MHDLYVVHNDMTRKILEHTSKYILFSNNTAFEYPTFVNTISLSEIIQYPNSPVSLLVLFKK